MKAEKVGVEKTALDWIRNGGGAQGNPLGSEFFTWELKKKKLVWSLLGQENISSKGLRC